MPACDECWALAYERAQIRGGSQADHYRDLLQENDGKPGHAAAGSAGAD